tara:strand:- start:201 stop:863 length:663 start_codon:yes stop_codon:yes gene_type:complete
MHKSVTNLEYIKSDIKEKIKVSGYKNYNPNIIAVSKTFKIDHINPLIEIGHLDFGENKVQEAIEKWTNVKKTNKSIKLHMIGKLQTNKVKHALKIFDYIHSVDNIKLAEKISNEETKIGKKIKIFLQVNLAGEDQKAGVEKNGLKNLYEFCKNKSLDVCGLMCLPPFNEDSKRYFAQLKALNDELGLKELSMGMSHDYLKSIEFKSTFLRIGSKIFGQRS